MKRESVQNGHVDAKTLALAPFCQNICIARKYGNGWRETVLLCARLHAVPGVCRNAQELSAERIFGFVCRKFWKFWSFGQFRNAVHPIALFFFVSSTRLDFLFCNQVVAERNFFFARDGDSVKIGGFKFGNEFPDACPVRKQELDREMKDGPFCASANGKPEHGPFADGVGATAHFLAEIFKSGSAFGMLYQVPFRDF